MSEARSIGRWRLVEPLARGGMGETWRALDPDGKRAVLKLVRPGLSGAPVRARFELERRALERLHGRVQGVPRLLEAGEDAGVPFLALQELSGVAVDRFLAESAARIGLRFAFACHVARLVGEVHAQGVIHGDLKPANLLVDRFGVPKLVDFGLAQLVGEAPRLGDDARLMSPRYAAPEQFRGEALSCPSDVYSLGITLCELLRSAHPRAEELGYRELEALALHGAPLPPSGCGPIVDALLAKATHSAAGERFADAAEFARALLAAVGG